MFEEKRGSKFHPTIKLLDQTIEKFSLLANRTVWLYSIFASILLLGFVFAQIEWIDAREIFASISYFWLSIGVLLLLVEGFITAARFQLLTSTDVSYGECVTAVAWYVLMLIALPVRLGEIVGVALIVKHMRQRPGVAAASLFFQRIFDMLILLSMLLIGIVFVWSDDATGKQVASAAILVSFIATIVYFDRIISVLVDPLLPRRREKWPRRLLRLGLQARMFRRHHLTRRKSNLLGALTLVKWAVNLIAMSCVVLAVVPTIATVNALGVGVVYNLSAVIPIQTIGGFGISEAVLLGSFTWLGYSLAAGAPIAIVIRIAMISAPLVFWGIVVTSKAICKIPPKDAQRL